MNVTETAQKRIDDMLTFDSVFRIEIQGGGCTGFKYNFDIGVVIVFQAHMTTKISKKRRSTK